MALVEESGNKQTIHFNESEIPEATPEVKVALTDREVDRLVKKVERIVRKSGEYRDCIAFLRQNVNMNACAFFNNVSKETNKKLRIEVHHEPLTLYDIVYITVKKWMDMGEPLNDLLLAEEVTELHYDNKVGLIPLSKTIHEVVHNSDKLVIPMYMIYGNYVKFLKETEEYWKDDERIVKKIERMIENTKNLNDHSFDVLDPKFTYIECSGFKLPVKLVDEEDVTKEIESKVEKGAA